MATTRSRRTARAAGLWPAEEGPARPLGAVLLEDEDETGPRALTQYQRDPIGYIRDELKVPERTLRWSLNDGYAGHAWDGTIDPLVVIAEALRDWKDCGVESSTSTGKSFLAACLILWFIASWKHARAFTFAPKAEQLKKFIWKEITLLWPRFRVRFPEAELLELQIRMVPGQEGWGADGYAVGVRAGEESATKAQGMHAEHMLLVYEETPGIPQAVLEAGENTCTSEHNLRLALGNPDHQLDPLHRFCVSPDVVSVRISSLDHPNVVSGEQIVPGAVGRRFVTNKRRDWGEESPRYRSRIRGISPEEAVDALYRKVWIDAAVQRWRDFQERRRSGQPVDGPRAKGVDVARSQNGDQAAAADFVGPIVERVLAFACPDVVKLGERVYEEMQRDKVKPEHVGIDVAGVGGGTVDTLHKLLNYQGYVQALNGANRAEGYIRETDGTPYEDARATAMQFGNARAQQHWQLRHDLQYGDIGLPDDAELIEELLSIKTEERRGLTYIVDKDELRSDLGRSPNKCDAVVYGNFVRPRDKQSRPVDPPAAPWQDGRDSSDFSKNFVPFDESNPAPDLQDVGGFGELGYGF